ncbi:MAG TPA: hypothetical protein VNH63_09365 [Gemmatimonadales bacterium]|nr:hypothetical protein [Gemmatimonadales bacterium]
MLKPVLQVAAVGILGVTIWKLASFLLLPLLGTALGFVFAILKIALIVSAILFVVWFLKKKGGTEEKKDEGLSADAD